MCLSTVLLTASAEDSNIDGRYISNYRVDDDLSSKGRAASDDDLLYDYKDLKVIFAGYINLHNKWSYVNVNNYNRAFVAASSMPTNLYTISDLNRFAEMLPGNKYHIELKCSVASSSDGSVYNGNIKGKFSLFFCDSNNMSDLVEIVHIENYVVDNSFTLDLTIPDNWSGHARLGFKFSDMQDNGYGYYVAVNDVKVTDITNKNLDNALGKFADKISGLFDGLADAIGGFFDDLVEKIKGFFIPSEGFFDETKTKFDELLSAHLGFLYQAPALVGNVFGVIKDWSPPEQPTITLPAFDFKICETQVSLWQQQDYKFDFLSEQPWSTLYSFYKTFIFVLLAVAMVNLAIKKYHSIIDGGAGDDN